MIQYEIAPLDESKNRFMTQLSQLNLGRGFEMNACLLDEEAKGKCVLAIEEDILLGWAYTYQSWHIEDGKKVNYCPIHVFVAENRRREGIGRNLFNTARGVVKRWRRKPVVWPHDANAVAFMEAIGFDLTPP